MTCARNIAPPAMARRRRRSSTAPRPSTPSNGRSLANGVAPVRIGHIRSLTQRLAAGERWDFVFNICEGLAGAGREAQVPALLEAYGIPCSFSDSLVMALCLHKGLTKHVLRDKGIPTAPFAVIETMADLDGFTLPFPVFAKPVAEGTGKGVSPASRAENPAALRRSCRNLMSRFRQPVLVETFLPGREFTVGMIGTGRHAEIHRRARGSPRRAAPRRMSMVM